MFSTRCTVNVSSHAQGDIRAFCRWTWDRGSSAAQQRAPLSLSPSRAWNSSPSLLSDLHTTPRWSWSHSKHRDRPRDAVWTSPPTSAANVTLLAFVAERCAAARTPLLSSVRRWQSKSPARRAHRSKPAARPRMWCKMGQTDAQTDGQTDTVSLHRPCRIQCEQCQQGNSALQTPFWRSSTTCTNDSTQWKHDVIHKPGKHNVFSCRQRKTGPQSQATFTKSLVNFSRVVLKTCERQANKYTNMHMRCVIKD